MTGHVDRVTRDELRDALVAHSGLTHDQAVRLAAIMFAALQRRPVEPADERVEWGVRQTYRDGTVHVDEFSEDDCRRTVDYLNGRGVDAKLMCRSLTAGPWVPVFSDGVGDRQ